MGEIRIVGPGKTHGYFYPVCKKMVLYDWQGAVRQDILYMDRSCNTISSSRDNIVAACLFL